MNINNDTALFDEFLVDLPKKTICFFAVLLGSGILSNNISYAIVLPFLLIAFLKPAFAFSKQRIYLIVLTIAFIIFSSAKGYFRGNEIEYIARFVSPLAVFVLFCSIPGIGVALFRNRSGITFVCLILTSSFFYFVKSGNFDFTDNYMSGWTVTYSSNAGVSIWHYFAIPFCVTVILERFLQLRANFNSIFLPAAASVTLIMLILLTDTSAFWLALLFVLFCSLVPSKINKFATKFFTVIIILLMVDFITFGFLSNWISINLYLVAAADTGDILRAIQFDYFAQHAEFFGSGFGAVHDFPFELNQARQLSQIIYPYASELPILNIIFNGGILAVLWFSSILKIFVDIIGKHEVHTSKQIRYFVVGCAGVLIGSLSNPFLFAPGSMLLLAIAFDLADASSYRHQGRFSK